MEIFSEYIRKDHLLSQVDARIKLIVAFSVLMMVLSYKGLAFPIMVTLFCLLLCAKMKVPLRLFILRFSEPMFIAGVVLLLKVFFSGEEVLFSLDISGFRLSAHRDGLADGLLIAGRIIGSVSIMAVLGFSTHFTEFIAGLSWFRCPKGFIEIMMFAYRYIFVLLEDAMVIYGAQKNRLGYSNIKRGLNSFGTLAGSLTLKAFEHSQNTATAMVQRGYDGSMPMLKHKAFETAEIIGSVLLIAAMGFIWKI
ncbi:MAG: cobalt ECF transporter T component CbiQ [Nitrospirota bacterium]